MALGFSRACTGCKKALSERKMCNRVAVDNGFYYDFDVEKPFSNEDLEKIKTEMKRIVKSGVEIERFELPPKKQKSCFPI